MEEPADTEALTCTLPEDEKHTHTALCYGTWELTCDMEEHTHTEECSTAEETEATEETEETTEPEEEMSGMEIDPSLPVMGTAYASGAKTRAYSVMTLDADTTGATDPVSVENYITGATLYYRTDENAAWTNVSGATDIPGDADFKLEISYGNVPIDTLLAADGKMTYTLPALFRNATVNGKITSGSAEVGTITVAGGTVTLAFDTTWLAKQKTETNTVISGDFFVEAEVNLSQVGEGRTARIVIGNTTITIDFDGDIVAQYGNVDLTKTVSAISEETDGDYLTYTLTVTAGADGCPEVKVVDTFVDTQHIETVVLLSKGEIDSKKVRVEFSLEDMDMSGFQKGATYEQIKAYVLEHTGLKVSSLYISQIKRKCGLDVGQNYNLSKKEDAKVPKCPPEKEAAIRDALKYFQMI